MVMGGEMPKGEPRFVGCAWRSSRFMGNAWGLWVMEFEVLGPYFDVVSGG